MLVFANPSLTVPIFAAPATRTLTFLFRQAHPSPNSRICENEHPGARFHRSEPYCPCFCSPSHPHPDVPVLAGPPIPQIRALLSLFLHSQPPAPQHSRFGRPDHHLTLGFVKTSTQVLIFANPSLTVLCKGYCGWAGRGTSRGSEDD